MTTEGKETDYSKLTAETKQQVVSLFLMLNDKKKVATRTKVSVGLIDKVLLEYYTVLQDVLDDQEIKKKIFGTYTEAIDRATDVISKSLKLYQHQIDILDKTYSGSDKLIPDFLLKQIAVMVETTMPLIQTQMDIAQKHSYELNKQNIDFRRLDLQKEFDDSQDNFDENVAAIATYMNKSDTPKSELSKPVKVSDYNKLDEHGRPTVTIYQSRYELQRKLNISISSIRLHIQNGKLFNNLKLENYDPENE